MRKYKVTISEIASADLEEVADYIAGNLQEPAIALKQIGRMKDAILSLQTMPDRHRLVSDEHLASRGVRMFPVGNYLVFYTVNQSAMTVSVVRVLYGRREWEVILK